MRRIFYDSKSYSGLSALAAVVTMLTAGVAAKSGAAAFLLHLGQ